MRALPELIRPAPLIVAYLQQCVALMVSPAAWYGSSIDITDPPDGLQHLEKRLLNPLMFEKHVWEARDA